MTERNCPNCDAPMDHQEDDRDVGIVGGWFCDLCGEAFPDDLADDDFEDPRP